MLTVNLHRLTPKRKARESQRVSHYARRRADIAGQLVAQSIRSARKRGIFCDLEKADILPLPTHCPVFPWIKLTYFAGCPGPYNLATVDRIDNTKGYTKGNVAVVSKRANMIKSDATAEELQAIVHYVLRHKPRATPSVAALRARVKIDESQAEEIRTRYATGTETIASLSIRYNVSPKTIHRVIHHCQSHQQQIDHARAIRANERRI